MPHASGLSRQDTLPAKDPSWSYSPVPGQPAPMATRNGPLVSISNHTAHANALYSMPGASGLSCQDTLPTEDPSWSYSPVPGRPAPIPPRNEPLLFISNHTVRANASCSKNLPLPAAISKGNPHIETLMTSSTNTTNPDHSDKLLNFHHVCSPLI